jgi:hypothetical protein
VFSQFFDTAVKHLFTIWSVCLHIVKKHLKVFRARVTVDANDQPLVAEETPSPGSSMIASPVDVKRPRIRLCSIDSDGPLDIFPIPMNFRLDPFGYRRQSEWVGRSGRPTSAETRSVNIPSKMFDVCKHANANVPWTFVSSTICESFIVRTSAGSRSGAIKPRIILYISYSPAYESSIQCSKDMSHCS